VSATDAVMTGQHSNAFVAVAPARPNHAEKKHGRWGSAFFDNARDPAAAAHAPAQNTAIKGAPAVIDFDVHHGQRPRRISSWGRPDRDVLLDPPDAAVPGHRRRRGEARRGTGTPSSNARRLAPEDGSKAIPATPSRMRSCRSSRNLRPELMINLGGLFDGPSPRPARLDQSEGARDFGLGDERKLDGSRRQHGQRSSCLDAGRRPMTCRA